MARPQMRLVLQSGPSAEPVSLSDAKAHARVTGNDEDVLFDRYIEEARDEVEIWLGRQLMTAVYDGYLDAWPQESFIEIPRSPLVSVTSVTYYDSTGAATEWASTSYLVDTTREPGRLVLGYAQTWPTAILQPVNGIKVRFTCGYGDAPGDVPAQIRRAILQLVATRFECREDIVVASSVNVIAHDVWDALARWKVVWGIA